MRSRLLAGFSIAGVALVGLSGCTLFAPANPAAPPAATIEKLAAPKSMAPSTPAVHVSSTILPATGKLPWLLGGGATDPGKASAPVVWSSTDGAKWNDQTVAKVDGDFSGSLAGSDKLAALGGTVWKNGVARSVLWTSTDRTKWTEISLPDDFHAKFSLGDLGVSGDVVYGIATDESGAARGIRVDGDKVTELKLPAPKKGELLGAYALAANGKTVVLLASPGPEGDPSPEVSYRSTDGGKTWDDPVEITDSLGNATGIAFTGEGFVVTGDVPRANDAGGATGGAAWFSADGSSWAAEAVPAPSDDDPMFYSDNADAWLGVPQANGGIVTAVMANLNAAMSGIYQRDAAGQWTWLGDTTPNADNGDGGSALPVDGGGVLALIGDSGYARLGSLTPGSGWSDGTVLAARENLVQTADIYPADNRELMTLIQNTFTVDADLGWQDGSKYSLGEVKGDALTEVPWDPERAGQLTGVRLATDDSGAEIMVGSYFAPGSEVILAEGWFRSGPTADWAPITGFEGSGATFFVGAQKAGDLWTAYGTYRDSSNVSAAEHAMIWTSTDGVAWTRATGDFGSGALESSVVDVCTLPNGDPIAVGWVEASSGAYRTAVWTPQDSGWSRVDIGELGEKSGFASNCASGDDGVVMSAQVSGRDGLLVSKNGADWKQTFVADRGVTIGEPVSVPGGFAASGSLAKEGFSGPVVWLSVDGKTWEPVSIPSRRDGITTAVAPSGKDLIVTMSGAIGNPVSVVRDIAKVIASTKK